jgi:P4 family phage/plasmid primase-like protien
VEVYLEKVPGDDVSVEKAQAKLVEFLSRDVVDKSRTLPEGWDKGLSAEDKAKIGLSFSEANERWSRERIADYFCGEVVRLNGPGASGQWDKMVESTLGHIARSGLTSIEAERLLKLIQNQSKGAYNLPTLKKRLKEIQWGGVLGENHKEVAELALKELSREGEVRFDASRVWQWKGSAWEALDPIRLEGFVTRDFGTLPACKKHTDVRGIIKSIHGLCVDELAKVSITGVNFANGFLTEDLELVPHTPDFGATYVLPYPYVPENADCPMFMQLLDDFWGEDGDVDDKVLALQEGMAATLMGIAPRYQRAFCLMGRAGAGKSRIPAILEGLLPEDCRSTVPPWDWKDKFLPAQMHGKLLNVAGEIAEKRKIAGDIFKLVVEGSPITAQHKNHPPFTFKPVAAHWFCGNHLPSTDDFSAGFTRRWLFLDFNKQVDGQRKDVSIAETILEKEREQIVAWALQGLERLKRNKDYTLPACHGARVSAMMMKNHSVHYFLSQDPLLRIGRDAHEGATHRRTSLRELHDRYWHFCASTGASNRHSPQKFVEMLDELGHVFGFEKRVTDGQIEYEFITIKDRRAMIRAA